MLPSEGKIRAPDVWHSDVTWRPEPSMGSILRIVESPPLGGDTLWADMGAAYDLLDDETKEQIDELVALHDYVRVFGRHLPAGRAGRSCARSTRPSSTRSCGRIPRRDARRSTSTARSRAASRAWTTPTRSRCSAGSSARRTIPDVQCRFRWSPGSVAFWDNRATQHCVSNDFLPHRRVMERVTVVGDRPY